MSMINKNILINNELTTQIDECRKERTKIYQKLEQAKGENRFLQVDLDRTQRRNNFLYNRIKFDELTKIKEQGKILEYNFRDKRDKLEERYHKVLEANIQREKEHQNELKKLRLKNALFADLARKKGKNDLSGIKNDDENEIIDRIPILDLLIDKWKYIIKYKRNMLDKYIKSYRVIKSTFDKILEYLGIEKLESLPYIYIKDKEQMNSIQSYFSSSTTELQYLVEKRNLLKKQINILLKSKKEQKSEQFSFKEEKKMKIQNLKSDNDILFDTILRKQKLFKDLEEPTFDFLRKMQKTYLADFIVTKNYIDENSKMSEKNIISYLGTMYCYCHLIKDFDESFRNKKLNLKSYSRVQVNKDLDIMKKNFRLKLSRINSNSCANLNINKSIYNAVKRGDNFDDTIKKLANNLVEHINANSDYSMQNLSSMMTNNMSS